MRILGVDPGLRRTGFGLIDVRGSQLSYVASGVIRVPDGALTPDCVPSTMGLQK